MRFSLGITTSMPIDRAIEYSVLAEKKGYHRIWLGEDVLSREVFSYMSIIAQHTDKIGLATGITTPYARNITDIACAAAGLSMVSGDRFSLGMGAGGFAELEKLTGEVPRRPVEVMEEAVSILRSLFAGDVVTHSGLRAKLNGYRLAVRPEKPLKIFMGVRGPRMLSLAGRVADGVIFSGPWSYLGKMMETVDVAASESGRKDGDIERVLWNSFALLQKEEDIQQARIVVATMAASLPRDLAKHSGLGENVRDEIGTAITSGDYDRARSLVPDALLNELCICGSPGIMHKKFDELQGLGFNEVVIGPPFGSDGKKTISTFSPREV